MLKIWFARCSLFPFRFPSFDGALRRLQSGELISRGPRAVAGPGRPGKDEKERDFIGVRFFALFSL